MLHLFSTERVAKAFPVKHREVCKALTALPFATAFSDCKSFSKKLSNPIVSEAKHYNFARNLSCAMMFFPLLIKASMASSTDSGVICISDGLGYLDTSFLHLSALIGILNATDRNLTISSDRSSDEPVISSSVSLASGSRLLRSS